MEMMMAKFRKKPVVIEAFELQNPCAIPRWFQDAIQLGGYNVGGVVMDKDGTASIVTLEGTMRADLGDWIIRGVKGEIYPCKPDIFAATYDPA
jgi:hypothetical protein